MITVKNKEDLKRAVIRKEKIIVVKGKIAKKLLPLAKVKKAPVVDHYDTTSKKLEIIDNTSVSYAGAIISSATGISVAVAITLIITVGVVTIIGIFNDYNIKISGDEIILEKK